jgi:hypothetical protein
MAVSGRKPEAGLVHHSDQGSQPGLKRSSQQCRWGEAIDPGGGVGACAAVPPTGVMRLSSRRLARRAGRSGDSRMRASRSTGGGAGSGRHRHALVEYFGGRSPAERLSRAGVQGDSDGGEVIGTVPGQVGSSGEVLAQQSVGVLVGAALPRALWIAEVDLQAVSIRSCACWAISAPWSQVSDRRSCSGSVVIAATIASRTASAP